VYVWTPSDGNFVVPASSSLPLLFLDTHPCLEEVFMKLKPLFDNRGDRKETEIEDDI
jgi:hypothetical protein